MGYDSYARLAISGKLSKELIDEIVISICNYREGVWIGEMCKANSTMLTPGEGKHYTYMYTFFEKFTKRYKDIMFYYFLYGEDMEDNHYYTILDGEFGHRKLKYEEPDFDDKGCEEESDQWEELMEKHCEHIYEEREQLLKDKIKKLKLRDITDNILEYKYSEKNEDKSIQISDNIYDGLSKLLYENDITTEIETTETETLETEPAELEELDESEESE